MLKSDSAFKPRLDRLLREHATLDHYNHELLNELTMIADGRPADRVKSSVREQGREAWREQLETLREHARRGEGPGLVALPFALARNHRRHLVEGYRETRRIFAESGTVETAGKE